MSIILDALKRSDRERRLQKPPDLSQIYQENHSPRRTRMVWVLLIVFVFIAGIAGAYLFFQKNPGVEDAKRSEQPAVAAGTKKHPPEKAKSLRSFSKQTGGTSARKSVSSVPMRRKSVPQDNGQSADTETVQNNSEDSEKGNPFAAMAARANRMKEDAETSGDGESKGHANPLAKLFSKIGKPLKKSDVTETVVSPSPEPKQPILDSQANTPAPSKDSAAILSTPRGISLIKPESAQVEAPKPASENQAREEAGRQGSASAAPA